MSLGKDAIYLGGDIPEDQKSRAATSRLAVETSVTLCYVDL